MIIYLYNDIIYIIYNIKLYKQKLKNKNCITLYKHFHMKPQGEGIPYLIIYYTTILIQHHPTNLNYILKSQKSL